VAAANRSSVRAILLHLCLSAEVVRINRPFLGERF
jgi:hypothetical protein